MYKVNLKIVAQGARQVGCLRLQFSTHFSITKTEEVENTLIFCHLLFRLHRFAFASWKLRIRIRCREELSALGHFSVFIFLGK